MRPAVYQIAPGGLDERPARPVIGGLPVAKIDTGLVLRCVEPHWVDKNETMSRIRGRIESIFSWATARGYRAGDNPARWKGHLDHLLPKLVQKRGHHAALPYSELPAFTRDFARSPVSGRGLLNLQS
jgi:hypothetical protein